MRPLLILLAVAENLVGIPLLIGWCIRRGMGNDDDYGEPFDPDPLDNVSFFVGADDPDTFTAAELDSLFRRKPQP